MRRTTSTTPKEEAPLVSVLMPAYDADATIAEAVKSVLGQDEGRLELIVIDDGSTVPVTSALAEVRDRRVRIVRHARNRGLSAALNTGLRLARARYISQLDADDLWDPAYLSTVLPRFDDPTVGLVYANAWLVGHPAGQKLYIEDASVHPMDRFPVFAEQNPVPSPVGTMRTAAVRALGGWATWLRQAMDYHLYARLIAAGWRFTYVDHPLGWYRWPEPARGMSWNRREMELSELKMWLAFSARHPLTPGPRRQVRLRLGREARRLAARRRRGQDFGAGSPASRVSARHSSRSGQ